MTEETKTETDKTKTEVVVTVQEGAGVKKDERKRLRELGITIGFYPTGKNNAITDVAGVRVGHSTIVRGSGRLIPGKGPVRTGVTAILPNEGNIFAERVLGGGFILNGAGEVSGLTQVLEWGVIETPILLTNTLSVGACSEAVVKYMVERYPGIGGEDDVIIPLVGECDDSWLNDIAGRHIRDENVYEAITSAKSGAVEEGNVGGGTGMVSFDFSGGIGTSSRKLPPAEGGYTLGVLVMSNVGKIFDLRIDGVAVGQMLAPKYTDYHRRERAYGSIITVVATDAPLLPHQLNRLSKRVALGIGRVGSLAAHGSGEIVVAFSTANTVPRETKKRAFWLQILPDNLMDPLYRAVIEATEEAIVNALCMATDMTGIYNRLAPALPLNDVREILQKYQPPKLERKIPKPPRKIIAAGPLHQVGMPIKKKSPGDKS